MNILCISNFYPAPGSENTGGYELWCQEVSEGLQASGHSVWVLTSRLGASQDADDGQPLVRRDLELELAMETGDAWRQFFIGRRSREQRDLRSLQDAVATFAPDVILIWGMWNLPVSLAALAEELAPVLYYVGDIWPTLVGQFHLYLREPSKNRRRVLAKRLLRGIAPLWLPRPIRPVEILRFRHVLCPSQYLSDLLASAGIPRDHLHVVPGAIDTSRFASSPAGRRGADDNRRGLSLLWVGRLVSGKGVETAIRALGLLPQGDAALASVTLSIAGDGGQGYVDEVKALAAQQNVASRVEFLGAVAPNEIAHLYGAFDAFVFTSALQESFGRVLVEAMASGLPVIASSAGGAREILGDGAYGLVFEPGDAAELARQIARLVNDADLHRCLSETGQIRARSCYDIRRMTEQIEAHLVSVIKQR